MGQYGRRNAQRNDRRRETVQGGQELDGVILGLFGPPVPEGLGVGGDAVADAGDFWIHEFSGRPHGERGAVWHLQSVLH